MSIPGINIDYDALAAALLRAGGMPGISTGVTGSSGGVSGGAEVARGGDEDVGGVRRAESVASVTPSWADAVEESESRGEGDEDASGSGVSVSGDSVSSTGRMSGGSVGEVSTHVKKVKFGGMVDVGQQFAVASPQPDEVKYYASVVRSSNAKRLVALVEKLSGYKMPKAAREEFALCTYAAATMPLVVVEGKRRLGVLATVGDAAITLHVVTAAAAGGGSCESASVVRSTVASDSRLREVCLEVGVADCVSYPANVDRKRVKTTATAFEAVVGVLTKYREPNATYQFLRSCRILT